MFFASLLVSLGRPAWWLLALAGFEAGDLWCDAATATTSEALMGYRQAVGIRVKLRPLERAAFFKAYQEKKLKGIIYSLSGAFGNAATRLETFVAAGGPYVYLSRGLGPLWGFLFGWMSSFLERPVGMATLAAGFGQTPAVVGYGFGASVTESGLFLLPSTMAMLVVSPIAGRLSTRGRACG